MRRKHLCLPEADNPPDSRPTGLAGRSRREGLSRTLHHRGAGAICRGRFLRASSLQLLAGLGPDRLEMATRMRTLTWEAPAGLIRCTPARVAELADAQDLGSCGATRGSSNLPSRSGVDRCSQCLKTGTGGLRITFTDARRAGRIGKGHGCTRRIRWSRQQASGRGTQRRRRR